MIRCVARRCKNSSKFFVLVTLVVLIASPAFCQRESAFRNVFWQPNELQNGSVIFFTVELNRPASRVTGKFLGKELSFFKADKPTVWYALAGADVETAPGQHDLTIQAVIPGRGTARTVKQVDVGVATFGTGTAEVPENYVNPDEASKKKIAADQILKERAFAHFIATPQWSGDFIKPVAAPTTESFGMTRVLNEEMTSQHRGTDFPIKEGSPALASNAGTVVLAHELFNEGNCVIIDHGQHFFTIYMHLSKIEVRVGEKVDKGQQLGFTGATGRVTGPHLHMGVRWVNAYLDPTKLIALTLPETHKIAPTRRAGARSSRRRR